MEKQVNAGSFAYAEFGQFLEPVKREFARILHARTENRQKYSFHYTSGKQVGLLKRQRCVGRTQSREIGKLAAYAC